MQIEMMQIEMMQNEMIMQEKVTRWPQRTESVTDRVKALQDQHPH